MTQLHPKFVKAIPFSREIDLYWNNDPHATEAQVRPTDLRPLGQSYNSRQVKGLSPNTTYTFTIVNENTTPGSGFTPGSVGPIPVKTHAPSAASYLVQAEIGSPPQGSFDLLVPKKTFIAHYTRPDDTILQGGWRLVDTLTLSGGTQTEGNQLTLIQSFLTPDDFEAIARVKPQQGSDFLVSYQFQPAKGNQHPIPVISDHGPVDQVDGALALAQTDQGTFLLIVPRAGTIFTYTHSSGTIQGTWSTGPTLNPPHNSKVSAVSLAQTDGGGGFVALARITPAGGGGDTMAAYQLAGQGQSWQGPFDVTSNGGPITPLTGRPTLIQSYDGSQAGFELLVPVNGELQHYTHTPGSIGGDWSFDTTLNPANNDSDIKPISVSLVQDDTGNLDAVARVAPPQGDVFFAAYQFTSASGWSDPVNLVDDHGNVITAGN